MANSTLQKSPKQSMVTYQLYPIMVANANATMEINANATLAGVGHMHFRWRYQKDIEFLLSVDRFLTQHSLMCK